jgi:molybdate transport system substrate-binding protein
MRMRSLFAAGKIGFVILLAQGLAAEAAEVKVFAAAGFRTVVSDVGAQFERQTGHKLVTEIGVGGALQRKIDAGEAFDVAFLNTPQMDNLIKAGKIAAGTRADIARAGVGVGVRAGAAKPDISSTDALKRTLVAAKSVSYSGEGASGPHFLGVLERLGIAEEMKSKIKPLPPRVNVEAVVKGEADLVVVVIPSILAVPGVELVGPLPSELQTYIGFSAGVSANAKEPEAAKALVKLLTAEESVSVIKAKGLEPIAR